MYPCGKTNHGHLWPNVNISNDGIILCYCLLQTVNTTSFPRFPVQKRFSMPVRCIHVLVLINKIYGITTTQIPFLDGSVFSNILNCETEHYI